MRSCRGFTLIELVVSLGIVGVLSMALGSTILLSMRAMPTPGVSAETRASAGRALQVVGSDIRLATSVTMPNTRTLTLSVPDRTGDGSPEAITYQWTGTPGDPLVRQVNADTSTLVVSVGDLVFTAIKRAGIAVDDRTSVPSDRIRATLTIGSAEAVGVTGEFRLLNARAPS